MTDICGFMSCLVYELKGYFPGSSATGVSLQDMGKIDVLNNNKALII